MAALPETHGADRRRILSWRQAGAVRPGFTGFDDLGALLFRGEFSQGGPRTRDSGDRRAVEPDKQRVVRRRRGPMAARGKRLLPGDRERAAARPLLQQWPQLLDRREGTLLFDAPVGRPKYL